MFKRLKHNVKSLYWKAEHRFKKATKIKKAGYIVLFISILILIAVTTKAVLNASLPKYEEITETETQTTTAEPSSVVTTEAPPVEAPAVDTYYELNETYRVDDIFTSGFSVMLPNIKSDKPVAVKINAEMDKIKETVKEKNSSIENIKSFREYYHYYYGSFAKDTILFISVITEYKNSSGESVGPNKYYAYDFENEKLVDDSIIPEIFELNETEILEIVNGQLYLDGATPIENTDGITYFVMDKGAVWADVKVKALLGGTTYSELVQLKKSASS